MQYAPTEMSNILFCMILFSDQKEGYAISYNHFSILIKRYLVSHDPFSDQKEGHAILYNPFSIQIKCRYIPHRSLFDQKEGHTVSHNPKIDPRNKPLRP